MGRGQLQSFLRLKESTVRFWFSFCIAASSKKSWRGKKCQHVRPAGQRERQEHWAQLARVLGLCSISSTREERLGTPACPRAEAAGIEERLRLQPL